MAMSSHIRCCSRVGVGVVHVFSMNYEQNMTDDYQVMALSHWPTTPPTPRITMDISQGLNLNRIRCSVNSCIIVVKINRFRFCVTCLQTDTYRHIRKAYFSLKVEPTLQSLPITFLDTS